MAAFSLFSLLSPCSAIFGNQSIETGVLTCGGCFRIRYSQGVRHIFMRESGSALVATSSEFDFPFTFAAVPEGGEAANALESRMRFAFPVAGTGCIPQRGCEAP